MKVLIIDDERAIRRALREILEFEGCQVSEAENGKEGIEATQKSVFDLISKTSDQTKFGKSIIRHERQVPFFLFLTHCIPPPLHIIVLIII